MVKSLENSIRLWWSISLDDQQAELLGGNIYDSGLHQSKHSGIKRQQAPNKAVQLLLLSSPVQMTKGGTIETY